MVVQPAKFPTRMKLLVGGNREEACQTFRHGRERGDELAVRCFPKIAFVISRPPFGEMSLTFYGFFLSDMMIFL